MAKYGQINYQVMCDTQHHYTHIPELQDAIASSVSRQFMVAHDQAIAPESPAHSETHYIISGKRTFHAAKAYKGRKVAVLNFANNHSIGGSPFSAGAQEESLCRCSTLLPCLQAMEKEFYQRHRRMFDERTIDHMGNDDLIYTPDVLVFKSDELADPVHPQMLPRDQWYRVDVITCAAPELWRGYTKPAGYEAIITSRIGKILSVAASQKVDVLVLGAWGCGAFKNPSDVVAHTFLRLLKGYGFHTVEFALSTAGNLADNSFGRALGAADRTEWTVPVAQDTHAAEPNPCEQTAARTEYEKMLGGEVYNAVDPSLLKDLNACKDLCWEYNQIRPTLIRERNQKLRQILGQSDEDTFINQPFYCDFGSHIRVGKRFFANFNWTVLDEAYVTIGDDCFIGPNVGIYTACHSTDPTERNTRQEWALPVSIGNNCWIGGGVTILPGVTIGDNVTIGAGSVVVKDIPSDCVAVGNPAKVVKHLNKA